RIAWWRAGWRAGRHRRAAAARATGSRSVLLAEQRRRFLGLRRDRFGGRTLPAQSLLHRQHLFAERDQLRRVEQLAHLRKKMLLFFLVMVLGLLPQDLELGLEGLFGGRQFEQISEQTLQRQVFFE